MAEINSFKEKEQLDLVVASIRYQGRYDEMGKYIKELFSVVRGSAAGSVMALYYDDGFEENNADIEVCVPVKNPVAGKNVTTRTLEGGKYISLVHVGPYDSLSEAYGAMNAYIQEKNLKIITPSREVYLKGPGMFFKGNPQKYETEIMMKLDETSEVE